MTTYVAFEVRVFHADMTIAEIEAALKERIQQFPVEPDYPCDPMNEVVLIEHAGACEVEYCGTDDGSKLFDDHAQGATP